MYRWKQPVNPVQSLNLHESVEKQTRADLNFCTSLSHCSPHQLCGINFYLIPPHKMYQVLCACWTTQECKKNAQRFLLSLPQKLNELCASIDSKNGTPWVATSTRTFPTKRHQLLPVIFELIVQSCNQGSLTTFKWHSTDCTAHANQILQSNVKVH